MVARMLGAAAQGESERMGARVRMKGDELAARGSAPGGRAPYGYSWSTEVDPATGSTRRTYVINPTEAEAVRTMVRGQGRAGRAHRPRHGPGLLAATRLRPQPRPPALRRRPVADRRATRRRRPPLGPARPPLSAGRDPGPTTSALRLAGWSATASGILGDGARGVPRPDPAVFRECGRRGRWFANSSCPTCSTSSPAPC